MQKKKRRTEQTEALTQALLYVHWLEGEQLKYVRGEELTEVAESTLPAVRTEALKGVHAIDAGASIFTGVVNAVVDV